MPTATPYLFFQGNCAEAVAAYADIFGSPPPVISRVSDAPPNPDLPAGSEDMILHAALEVGKGHVFLSDDISGTTPAMAGCNVHVSLDNYDNAKAAFDALAKGGEVRMPFEKTFWSAGFGALSDRFGIRWMIDTDAPA